LITAYFDGSGKSDASTVLTLGGVSASDVVWPLIEDAWVSTLADLSVPLWRTATMHNSMTPRDFTHASHRLFGVLRAFRQAPTCSYAASVVLSDFARVKVEGSPLESPEAVCVNFCCSNLVIPTASDLPIVMCFDRGEDFMHRVRRVWQQARRRGRQRRGWPWQTADIRSGLSADYAGLQAADLIAWSANRYERMRRTHEHRDARHQRAMWLVIESFFSAFHRSNVYDYERLLKLPQSYRRSSAP
jgi:hypothetical protein